MKKGVPILLSVGLLLFLADGLISLLDDTLILASGNHALGVVRGLVFLAAFGFSLLIYLLMGMTSIGLKRYFLPVVLFTPLVAALLLPLSIFQFDRIQQIGWCISVFQMAVGLGVLFALQKRWRPAWPFVEEQRLSDWSFSWPRSAGFLGLNLLVLGPLTILYVALCLSLAIDHFSGGFLALHRNGFSVRARKYTRDDGKAVQLIPMIHVAEAKFYEQILGSLSTNAVVMLEGVTDRRNLLRYGINYQRVARNLGLAEQQQLFTPAAARARHADVDVEDFSPGTIEFLNLVSLIHTRGLTAPVIQQFLTQSQDPALTKSLWDDLLMRRNAHLLEQIQVELAQSGEVVVPWGAAHMPGLARGIANLGFRPAGTLEYEAISFRKNPGHSR